MIDPLLVEAATKSGLVWLRPTTQARSWPAWHRWHEGAFLVVSGASEQALPVLTGPVEVLVPSKSTGARLVSVLTEASPVNPSDPQWLACAQALAPHRLNSRQSPAELPHHWRHIGAQLTRLVPGELAERPGHHRSGNGQTPVQASSGGRHPWHWRGRRSRLRTIHGEGR